MAIRYIPSERAPAKDLETRILVAFTYPHGHPGVPGIPEGEGCPRCNAEFALYELVRRAEDLIDFTPPRTLWSVTKAGRLTRPRRSK